jgi:hypothetical protein
MDNKFLEIFCQIGRDPSRVSLPAMSRLQQSSPARPFLAPAGEPVHVALEGIVLPNDASVALHRKLGFTEVGTFREYAVKNGQYLSSVWMERRFP